MSRLMFWKSGVWSASGRPFPLESVTIRTFGRLALLLLTPEEGYPLLDGVDLPSSLLWYMSFSDTVTDVREDNTGLVNITNSICSVLMCRTSLWCPDREGCSVVRWCVSSWTVRAFSVAKPRCNPEVWTLYTPLLPAVSFKNKYGGRMAGRTCSLKTTKRVC